VRSNAAAGNTTIGLAVSKFGRAMRVPVTTISSSDWLSSAFAGQWLLIPTSVSQNPKMRFVLASHSTLPGVEVTASPARRAP
jgi:hypothetical protein